VLATVLPRFARRASGIVSWAAFGGFGTESGADGGSRGVHGRRASLSALIVGGQLGWLMPEDRARAEDPTGQDVYTLRASKTQTYMRFDGGGAVADIVKANLSTRLVRLPADRESCHGAEDGDLAGIRYVGAYEIPEAKGRAVTDEAAVDLMDDYESGAARWFVYDTSDQRSSGPFQLPLGGGNALAGLEIALHGMCPGERRVLYIPPALGYGQNGNKAFGVPPNALLRYDVELQSLMPFGNTKKTASPWRVVGQVVQ